MLFLGSDHGGLDLKEAISSFLAGRGLAVTDCGTDNGNSVDYPDYGERVARAVAAGEGRGILVCGTGIGMSIVANKFAGVRAALAHDVFTARMAKEHNDANILVLGGRVVSTELALQMVATWLDATFEGGRHQGRLEKIARIEQENRTGGR